MAGGIDLEFGSGGARRIVFAPLTGADERAAPGAAALMERLARPGAGRVSGPEVARLTVGDRDRALAALYAALYGDAVLADVVCSACGARFEIRFCLSELAASRAPDGSATGDPPGVAVGESRLRLPTGADLDGPPETLLERLTLSGPVPEAGAASAALEVADPAIELDLAGTCPECEAGQATPFSITRFLEGALARDRDFLMREIHLIAAGYGWSLGEILALTRVERQSFARLLIAERETAASRLRRAS